MARRSSGRPTKTQADKFAETAREIGADEDAFKRKLEKIAKAKPKDERGKE
ncbi:MAG TPA: hypothetical protein VF502_02755 [Stellaceae bacterium]